MPPAPGPADAHASPPTDDRAQAEAAAALFAAGNVDEARAIFSRVVTDDTVDIDVLFLGFQFYFRSGDYARAEALVRRRLALTGPDTDSEPTARAYTNLGLVLLYRKRLDDAELHFARSVEISRRIGDEFSLARALGNLALVPEERGDLDRAEALYREGLAIALRIGADKIVAGNYANLGDIARARARPDEARALWTRSLEMFDGLGITMWRADLTRKLAELDRPSPGT